MAADSRLIIWLESERTKMEADLRTLFLKRSDVQENVCQVLSDTVGVCMKSDLPACLSHRERLFIVNTMVKDFKEIFTAMEELIGYQYTYSMFGDQIYAPIIRNVSTI